MGRFTEVLQAFDRRALLTAGLRYRARGAIVLAGLVPRPQSTEPAIMRR